MNIAETSVRYCSTLSHRRPHDSVHRLHPHPSKQSLIVSQQPQSHSSSPEPSRLSSGMWVKPSSYSFQTICVSLTLTAHSGLYLQAHTPVWLTSWFTAKLHISKLRNTTLKPLGFIPFIHTKDTVFQLVFNLLGGIFFVILIQKTGEPLKNQ